MFKEDVINKIKEKGGRITPQREVIISLLIAHQEELLSADTLLSEAKTRNPAINATTIYRNLELLEDFGLLYTQRSHDGANQYKLVCHGGHHHHIICKNCGKMLPIDFCPVDSRLKELLDQQNFVLEEHILELYGHCKECSNDLQ